MATTQTLTQSEPKDTRPQGGPKSKAHSFVETKKAGASLRKDFGSRKDYSETQGSAHVGRIRENLPVKQFVR